MIKENAIYRYDKMNNLWCCHGIVYTRIIDGELWALDTYYNADFTIKYDEHQKIWRGEDIDETDLEFVMMIDDAIEVKENDEYLNLYNGDVYMIRVALNKIRELKSK